MLVKKIFILGQIGRKLSVFFKYTLPHLFSFRGVKLSIHPVILYLSGDFISSFKPLSLCQNFFNGIDISCCGKFLSGLFGQVF